MSASPVISPIPEQGILAHDPDGAYYVVGKNDNAQVIVVGAMHFTPGDYIKALGDLLDTHYELYSSEFMTFTGDIARTVLNRGFVSLIARKEH